VSLCLRTVTFTNASTIILLFFILFSLSAMFPFLAAIFPTTLLIRQYLLNMDY
jgi:hypothetical protein